MDRRADPCRSSGSLAHSGLASPGFKLPACAGNLRFTRSRVPFLAGQGPSMRSRSWPPFRQRWQGTGAPLSIAHACRDGRHEAEDAARCKSLSRAMASGKARGTPVREDGATRPPAPWRRRDSTTDARSVAVDVRNSGAIHRLRDMASEWPIQVRVTTANAGCLSTRNLNQNRRRPGVKAVPARTPTGSLASLPPGDHVR